MRILAVLSVAVLALLPSACGDESHDCPDQVFAAPPDGNGSTCGYGGETASQFDCSAQCTTVDGLHHVGTAGGCKRGNYSGSGGSYYYTGIVVCFDTAASCAARCPHPY